MIKNSLSLYTPIFIYCKDDNNMSKICLITFQDTNDFAYFHILIPSYSFDQRNFAVLTMEVDLMTTYNRFNHFIELFSSLFTGFS